MSDVSIMLFPLGETARWLQYRAVSPSDIEWLVQERRNASALAMELSLSCMLELHAGVTSFLHSPIDIYIYMYIYICVVCL